MSKKTVLHLVLIFLCAFIINALPSWYGKAPLKYNLSSDAEIHVVYLEKYSPAYEGNFDNDTIFALHRRAAGDLIFDKIAARIFFALGLDSLSGSIILETFALAIFLAGVYGVVQYSSGNSSLAFVIALMSIVPTHSLGGSSWGFFADGYLPRNLAAGIGVWILLLYLRAVRIGDAKNMGLVYLCAGLAGNWYPVLFLHLTMVLTLAEMIRFRSITKTMIVNLFIFGISISPAILDVVHKSGDAGPVDLALIQLKHRYMMFINFSNALTKYLRRTISYGALLVIAYLVAKKNSIRLPELAPWWHLVFASSLIALPGTIIENYTSYAQFFFSRTSVWMIFASLVIILTIAYTFLTKKSRYGVVAFIIFAGGLFAVQTNAYQFFVQLRQSRSNRIEQQERIGLFNAITTRTQPRDMILVDPSEANEIRAYAARSVPVSWKDGGVSLYDGTAAHVWLNRYREVSMLFESGNIDLLNAYARKNGMKYVVLDGMLTSVP